MTAGTSGRRRGGCGRPPSGPSYRPRYAVHRAAVLGLERRIDDPPHLLDGVLAGEAPRRADEGVAEQPLVRLAPVPERRGEVDRHVHRLAVEVRAWRLRLQRERHTVVLAEAQADEVALRRRSAGLVEQQPRRRLQLDDRLRRRLRHRLADAGVPRHAGPAPRIDLQPGGDERLDVRVGERRRPRRGSPRTGRGPASSSRAPSSPRTP